MSGHVILAVCYRTRITGANDCDAKKPMKGRWPNIVGFLARSIVLGLAIAFLFVWARPQWLGGPAQPDTPNRQPAGQDSFADSVSASIPSVVNIYSLRIVNREDRQDAVRRIFRNSADGRPQRQQRSLGSGVIIRSDGYVITNHHVIENADEVSVQLLDGREFKATLVGQDIDTDLALLRVPVTDLPAIPMGRSDQTKTGDVVLAIGNPYGLGHSVTQGIVSATGRAQLGLFTFENFIQTDAAINEGNSGGALVNTDGELVGINTAVLSASLMPDGISFAIPVNLVRGVSQQLITHGRVIRGWLGVSPQNLSAQRSEDIGIPGTIGIELYDVNGDGPGFRAGLRPGDVITRIDSNVIRVSRDALNLVAGMSPGSEILIDGFRDGRSFQVSAVIEERPPIP